MSREEGKVSLLDDPDNATDGIRTLVGLVEELTP
jgi:hypothetical protein